MNNYAVSMTSADLKEVDHLTFKMDLEPMTPEQIYEANKAYNAYEWRKKIDRYTEMGACFFKQLNSGTEYDKYFVFYKADGINFFTDFGYSSTLTSAGFVKVVLTSDNSVFTGLFSDSEGNLGRLANIPKAREIMRRSELNYSNSI